MGEKSMQVCNLALASTLLIGSSITATAADPVEKANAMCAQWRTAFNSKDINAQMAHYSDDPIRVAPEGYTVGNEAVRKQFTEDYRISSDHNCTIQRVAKDGSWYAGTWQITLATDKGPTKLGGNWVTTNVNGKINVEIWNLNPESMALTADRKPLTQ
jgi:ketosteroid isomerase-like protein